ncbi:LacI family transcriptional regulator [Marinomonas ushuaiensis DSM 15871]|uniref:LacI family transcriptional regulator n=1 Tax=Marinomonas ushuaiensis DSM 15871 TaxID=1122207 RepID=X7E130_9GAMM|nr:LacI family DNA-binding transcriptional regulator [Marinomonas ushuaiensis]ETX09677.1 LacI family transcriptional regulator [Marinomonas ushuaiensis DSM 15871]
MKIKKNARPTMVDVAHRAGVSQMTVSRAISGKGYVSEDVKLKVEAAAQEIGYVQNRLAYGLRSENTHLIAVVLPSLANSVFTDVLTGITDAVTIHGFRPVFGVTEYSQESEEKLVQDLLSWRPYGIVLAGIEHSEATRKAIISSGIRVAEIMDVESTPISIAFGLSHKDAGKKTAEYMLSKGHRRFIYVGSQGGRDLRALKRFEGFIEALNEAEATLISTEISTLPSSLAGGLSVTEKILQSSDKPDAIYYANDDLAAGGLMYCISNGIRTPEDIALAGFNGLPFLDAFPIQLTTVRTPRYEMGWKAGNYLVDPSLASYPEGESCIDVGFELIKGDTC